MVVATAALSVGGPGLIEVVSERNGVKPLGVATVITSDVMVCVM